MPTVTNSTARLLCCLLLLGSVLNVSVAAQTARAPQFPYTGTLSDRATFLFPHFVKAGQEHGLDPRVLFVVGYLETRFQPQQVSPRGAQGLMQLIPATAARYGVQSAFDFRDNLNGGAKYLAYLARLFNGNLAHMLAAYNAGEGAVLAYLKGGSYVGGSGTRYTVTPQTKGFGTGIPQNAETVAYVKQGLELFNGLTQARLFDPYVSSSAGPLTVNVLARTAALPVRISPAPAAHNNSPVEAEFEPTNSFYFGLEESEAAPSVTPPRAKNKALQAESPVTGSYLFP